MMQKMNNQIEDPEDAMQMGAGGSPKSGMDLIEVAERDLKKLCNTVYNYKPMIKGLDKFLCGWIVKINKPFVARITLMTLLLSTFALGTMMFFEPGVDLMAVMGYHGDYDRYSIGLRTWGTNPTSTAKILPDVLHLVDVYEPSSFIETQFQTAKPRGKTNTPLDTGKTDTKTDTLFELDDVNSFLQTAAKKKGKTGVAAFGATGGQANDGIAAGKKEVIPPPPFIYDPKTHDYVSNPEFEQFMKVMALEATANGGKGGVPGGKFAGLSGGGLGGKLGGLSDRGAAKSPPPEDWSLESIANWLYAEIMVAMSWCSGAMSILFFLRMFQSYFYTITGFWSTAKGIFQYCGFCKDDPKKAGSGGLPPSLQAELAQLPPELQAQLKARGGQGGAQGQDQKVGGQPGQAQPSQQQQLAALLQGLQGKQPTPGGSVEMVEGGLGMGTGNQKKGKDANGNSNPQQSQQQTGGMQNGMMTNMNGGFANFDQQAFMMAMMSGQNPQMMMQKMQNGMQNMQNGMQNLQNGMQNPQMSMIGAQGMNGMQNASMNVRNPGMAGQMSGQGMMGMHNPSMMNQMQSMQNPGMMNQMGMPGMMNQMVQQMGNPTRKPAGANQAANLTESTKQTASRHQPQGPRQSATSVQISGSVTSSSGNQSNPEWIPGKPMTPNSGGVNGVTAEIPTTGNSSVETSNSSIESSKPGTETSKPGIETSKPGTETSKAGTETSRPGTETSKVGTETCPQTDVTSIPCKSGVEFPASKPCSDDKTIVSSCKAGETKVADDFFL